MPQTYKQRYDRYKKEVDAAVGRPLGKWGQFKALFAPNSLSTVRKQAIDNASNARRAAVTREEKANRLYQTHNIIGRTQAPGQRPTIYYRTSSGTFGHITQEHGIANNIGREPARKDPRYNFGNTGPHGVLEERIGNRVVHTSRNPFMPAVTGDDRRALQQAHHDFPDIKARY